MASALQYNDPSASESDIFFTNASMITPNSNFTVNGQKGLWRTLSKDEWKYLIDNNGAVWSTINGVNGLIIFCDGYSGSRTGLTEIPNGCLFLPAAGYRRGYDGDTSVLYAGSLGFYWSASPLDVNRTVAFRKYFDRSGFYPIFTGDRNEAIAVRLVTESK